MLANSNLNSDLELLIARNGWIVVVGNRGTVDINPRLMMIKETSICGIILSCSIAVRVNCFAL
jgi:NADPH2:quinone reductase